MISSNKRAVRIAARWYGIGNSTTGGVGWNPNLIILNVVILGRGNSHGKRRWLGNTARGMFYNSDAAVERLDAMLKIGQYRGEQFFHAADAFFHVVNGVG